MLVCFPCTRVSSCDFSMLCRILSGSLRFYLWLCIIYFQCCCCFSFFLVCFCFVSRKACCIFDSYSMFSLNLIHHNRVSFMQRPKKYLLQRRKSHLLYDCFHKIKSLPHIFLSESGEMVHFIEYCNSMCFGWIVFLWYSSVH